MLEIGWVIKFCKIIEEHLEIPPSKIIFPLDGFPQAVKQAEIVNGPIEKKI